MTDKITISPFNVNDSDLHLIGDLYCLNFLGENFSVENLEGAIENLNKHAAYEGFTGFKAIDQSGKLAGFVYGYISLPGQFYREKIAAQLTEEQTLIWLSDCFEFVELAVNPTYKRMGVGSRLHDRLMNEIENKTAVLTTSVENSPAISLYENKAWHLIKTDVPVITSENLQVIMGKENLKR